MMKNILVAIDFSNQSRQAFKVAVDLANRTNGKVNLLHVLYLANEIHKSKYSYYKSIDDLARQGGLSPCIRFHLPN